MQHEDIAGSHAQDAWCRLGMPTCNVPRLQYSMTTQVSTSACCSVTGSPRKLLAPASGAFSELPAQSRQPLRARYSTTWCTRYDLTL